MGASSSVNQKSVHDFTVKDSNNKDVDLSIYKGKVLLIVNVAPKCGWANSNYSELTELYHRYKDTDFEILAFPCNQFLKQAPGTGEELQSYACEKFQAEYPVFQKVSCVELENFVTRTIKTSITSVMAEFSKHLKLKDYKGNVNVELVKVFVNGKNSSPVYKFLKGRTRGFMGSSIKWNFTKFLIDKEGNVIQRYGTTTSPLSIEGDIRKALGQS